jgi:hypothetical protein
VIESQASPPSASPPSAALAKAPTEAERRVQLAKARLTQHLHMLEGRARNIARQSAWIAGMVLLGVVGAAAAAAMFRPKPRRSRQAMYYAGQPQGRGRSVGTALMLAAFGLLSRGARSFQSRRLHSYES